MPPQPPLWRLTHRSLLPLGLCFPARARSSSSEGCLYRKRLRAKTGSQESSGMGAGGKAVNPKTQDWSHREGWAPLNAW